MTVLDNIMVGRHHLLITERGCCGRFGSLITTAAHNRRARC